jgi:hypothetical protein
MGPELKLFIYINRGGLLLRLPVLRRHRPDLLLRNLHETPQLVTHWHWMTETSDKSLAHPGGLLLRLPALRRHRPDLLHRNLHEASQLVAQNN